MKRQEQVVELPKLRRARNGIHVIYGAYEDSICPQHQFCCYTGDEVGRCSICHSSYHDTEDHGDLPPGRIAPCLCSRCGELFTSATGFSMHFGKGWKCRNPEKRGLILVNQNGWHLWAKPGSRPENL
jgi:hypothetical protein